MSAFRYIKHLITLLLKTIFHKPIGSTEPLKVVELFAGVGGFRLGLEGWNGRSPSSSYRNEMPQNYKVVWSNQHEPGSKVQYANDVYRYHFDKIQKLKLKK